MANNKTNLILMKKQTFTNRKIRLCIMILTVFCIACKLGSDKTKAKASTTSIDSIHPVIAQDDSLDAVVNSIIDIAANDFYKNQQPLPTKFRNVQIKYSVKPSKEILYLLCGQFATQYNPKNDEWTHFTTIKNSAYEQWIGPSGLTYCENAIEIPYIKTNLSTVVEKKILSLKNK